MTSFLLLTCRVAVDGFGLGADVVGKGRCQGDLGWVTAPMGVVHGMPDWSTDSDSAASSALDLGQFLPVSALPFNSAVW